MTEQPRLPPSRAEDKLDREQRQIMKVYGALSAAIILGFIPNGAFVLVALLLFCLVTPLAGRIRRKADPASLTANHMTYIIRTVWIFTLFAAVTIALATIYVLCVYNIAPLQPCVNTIMAQKPTSNQAMAAALQPCIGNFMSANMRVFLTAGIAAGVPVVLYLVYRVARGVGRAQKGYRLENVQHWF